MLAGAFHGAVLALAPAYHALTGPKAQSDQVTTLDASQVQRNE